MCIAAAPASASSGKALTSSLRPRRAPEGRFCGIRYALSAAFPTPPSTAQAVAIRGLGINWARCVNGGCRGKRAPWVYHRPKAGSCHALPLCPFVILRDGRITSVRKGRYTKGVGLVSSVVVPYHGKLVVTPLGASFTTSCQEAAMINVVGCVPLAIRFGPTFCCLQIIKGLAIVDFMGARNIITAHNDPAAARVRAPCHFEPMPISVCAVGTIRSGVCDGIVRAYDTLFLGRRCAFRPFIDESLASVVPSFRRFTLRMGLAQGGQSKGLVVLSAKVGVASIRAQGNSFSTFFGIFVSACAKDLRMQRATVGNNCSVFYVNCFRALDVCTTFPAATPFAVCAGASRSTYGPLCANNPAEKAAAVVGPCGLSVLVSRNGCGFATRINTYPPDVAPIMAAHGGSEGAVLVSPELPTANCPVSSVGCVVCNSAAVVFGRETQTLPSALLMADGLPRFITPYRCRYVLSSSRW